MKTKICGITNIEDAHAAILHGAWALGFNFYKNSPRYVSHDQAKWMIARLPKSVIKIGIFIEPSFKAIEMFSYLDLIQVYQDYEGEPSFKQRMILAIAPDSSDTLPPISILKQYAMVLIDAPHSKTGLMGGSGQLANWKLACELSKELKLILAGGLNSKNILDAMHSVPSFAVDVCSGVELKPGIKDHAKLQTFMHEVNQYE